jgi:outer membrane protein assembly factor BamD
VHYEQITDEKKDLQPLLDATEKINFFIKTFPNSDYALDLKFKKDLIQNQLAAKELYVAKYYISTQKWVPAINRLKIIIEKYEKTIFIEEALHRLVEIHYYLGLKEEAEKYAQILGYNYNSSEWFEQSYKILNKNYQIAKKKKNATKKNDSFLNKILKKIK